MNEHKGKFFELEYNDLPNERHSSAEPTISTTATSDSPEEPLSPGIATYRAFCVVLLLILYFLSQYDK